MTVEADVLNRAAELIERDGWWSRSAPTLNGWDITGALAAMAPSAVAYHHILRVLRSHLGIEAVSAWNNADGRTKAEVVAALRVAAKRVS